MLVIYSPHRNPRIEYILQYVFEERLSLPYSLTDVLPGTDTETPSTGYWLNYSETPLPAATLNIPLHNLMLEQELISVDVKVNQGDYPALFPSMLSGFDMDHDVFAHCFYLLTRYEEYLPYEPDEHGRFPSSASLAVKEDFLHLPVVDLAIEALAHHLSKRIHDWTYEQPKASVQLTYDIDAPFAYHGKAPWRQIGGAVIDILSGRPEKLWHRISSISAPDSDPYHLFDELLDQLDEADAHAHFFILLNHEGKNNPSVHYENKHFRYTLDRLQSSHTVGIHPSYDCHHEELIGEEVSRFISIMDQPPTKSRYHFLRISFPESMRLLIAAGIKADYSMIYPDKPGFRAGTAFSFPFYDLKAEQNTDLNIHPACLMDATFEYYQRSMKQEEIVETYKAIVATVESVGGVASVIFHNDLLSNYASKYDWRPVHSYILKK